MFTLAVAQPGRDKKLTVEGCRILARQFRDRVEAHQARAAALVGRSHACPFDLHTLLPVPEAILLLGPTHPHGAGLAGGALGHHRPAAPGQPARQGHGRPTAAQGPCGDRLQLLHPPRNAGRGDRPADRTVAGAAVRAPAPDAGLNGARMDASADPPTGSDEQAVSQAPLTAPPADGREGEGSPYLTLEGFTGPLDHLLVLARAQKIDLFDISLTALLDQLAAALRAAPASMPLGQKGDWVVMAAWLVQLRTRLLLPADAPGQQQAAAEADQLRDRLLALEDVQALALWLEQRPQLGRDVFARGRAELFGVSVEAGPAIDVTEFLWASLALFDDEAPPDTAVTYQPAPLRLHSVAEARTRILQRLTDKPEGVIARSASAGRAGGQPASQCAAPGCGAPAGRRPWWPVWNWPGRARWRWGRGRISSPSTSHRSNAAAHSSRSQLAESGRLRSGVRTVPSPAQTGQTTGSAGPR